MPVAAQRDQTSGSDPALDVGLQCQQALVADEDVRFKRQGAGDDGIDVQIDDAEIYRYRMPGEEQPHSADDFESGGFAGWNGAFGNGLTVTERGPVGKLWLRGDLAAGDSYLMDSTPRAAGRARLRFDLDTSALSAKAVKALSGHSTNAPASADEHLQVSVRRMALGPQIRVGVKDGVWHFTGWHPLAETEVNRVELAFRAASGAGTTDGELRVWLDGVEVPAITGLANHQSPVDSVLFGAVDVGSGNSGQIFLDNYQLWRPHASGK